MDKSYQRAHYVTYREKRRGDCFPKLFTRLFKNKINTITIFVYPLISNIYSNI